MADKTPCKDCVAPAYTPDELAERNTRRDAKPTHGNMVLHNGPLRPARHVQPCLPEVVSFERGPETVLFDANSMAVVSMPQEAGRAVIRSGMQAQGVLGVTVAPVFSCGPKAPVKVNMLVLNLTHACNLRCAYCFVHQESGVMSKETAHKAISLFAPCTPINVCFFGGEPLLAANLLLDTAYHIEQHAEENHVGKVLHVTTNGTLLDKDIAGHLRRLNFTVLLSLDGPKGLHDTARPMADGFGSWDKVMHGLATLNAVGIKPMARATCYKEARLRSRLEFFNALYLKGAISGAAIEPATLSEGCGGAREGVDMTEEWHDAALWQIEKVKSGQPFLPFHYFQKIMSRLVNGQPSGAECGAGKAYFTVAPDGTMYACHREQGSGVGSVDSFDPARIAQWHENTIGQYQDCPQCWARYVCGGGCRVNRLLAGGGLASPMPALCNMRRALIAEVVWMMTQLTKEEARRVAGIVNQERRVVS